MSVDKNQRKYENFVVYLKVIACLLITNSHCGDIYPISLLAIGGSWGNAIFFILSGYCLANIKNDFVTWYIRRIKRLIPSLIIMILVSVFITDGIQFFSDKNLFDILIYFLNKYWFVSAILIMYVFYYCIMKITDVTKIYVVIGMLLLVYLYIYVFFTDKTVYSIEPYGLALLKCLVYFLILLIGGIIRKKKDVLKEVVYKISRVNLCLLVLATLIIWMVLYYVIVVMKIRLDMQFLIHGAIICFAVSIFFAFMKFEKEFSIQNTLVNVVLNIISKSTLEIYLVQITFKKYVTALTFPVNWIMFWLIAIGGGVLLQMVIATVEKRQLESNLK